MYAMDIFEGEGSFNNSSNIVDNMCYKICINENPIQVPAQERKKKIEGRRKETAWEEYQMDQRPRDQMDQRLREERTTKPRREEERRCKRKEEPSQESQRSPAQEEAAGR